MTMRTEKYDTKTYSINDRIKLIEEFKTTEMSYKEFAKKYNIYPTAIYDWSIALVKQGLIKEEEGCRNKHKLVKNNKKTKKETPSSIMRIKLYNELKKEYEELQKKLNTVHHRMQMVGEQWTI